jgi:hypothetical protein
METLGYHLVSKMRLQDRRIPGNAGGRTMLSAKAGAAGTAPKVKHQTQPYNQTQRLSRENLRKLQIEKRRVQIPKAYRGIYDRAVKGRSLRSAVNAQCLECCCWQRREIALCSDAGCPLHRVRPYQDNPQTARNGRDKPLESAKLATGRLF